MSNEEFIKTLRRLLKKVIIAVVAGLFLMIFGGGFTMAKIFNVKGKADKTYVDSYFGAGMKIMEDRNILLERRMDELDKGNAADQEVLNNLNEGLKRLNEQYDEHMSWHMERTRGLTDK